MPTHHTDHRRHVTAAPAPARPRRSANSEPLPPRARGWSRVAAAGVMVLTMVLTTVAAATAVEITSVGATAGEPNATTTAADRAGTLPAIAAWQTMATGPDAPVAGPAWTPVAPGAPAVPPPPPAPEPDPGARCEAPAPQPAPAPAPAPAAEPSNKPDEGWFERVWSAASEWFADKVVLSGLDPLLRLLGGTVLTAPDPSCMPGMVELWQNTRTIALALYGLLVTAGAVLVMGHQTIQTRYSVRELLPRVVLGFAAANLSLWIISQAVAFGNALTSAVLGQFDPHAAAAALRDLIITAAHQGQVALWLIFVTGAFLVLVVVVLIGYVQRLALLAILTVAAPLALACHALPHLDRLAAWWWRAFAAILGAQFAQALTLVVALKVFLAPGGLASSGTLAEPDMKLFLALGVVLIMAMIPIHVMRAAKLGQGGSLLGSLVRTVFMIKTFGMLKAGTHAAGVSGRRRPVGTASAVPRRPRTGPRTWPFGSGTGPAGRSLADARRAQRAGAPNAPRPRPGQLRPPGQPRPPAQPNAMRSPAHHRPPSSVRAAGAMPTPTGPTMADARRAPQTQRAPGTPATTRPTAARPRTGGGRPQPTQTPSSRRAGRAGPPRAGGRATPPRAHSPTPPRPPRPRPGGPPRRP